jgi:ligand-binding sensor domain-containing protein
MKNKRNVFSTVLIIMAGIVYLPVKAQQKNGVAESSTYGPHSITRNIIKDRKGNIWIASWEGIFKYDGKLFTNITSKVSSSRFFSILQDRKGNFWFGSIGSGVYCYNGQSFKNFTTKDGLAANEVTCIYEDKAGNIWFGTGGGASRYDGKTFRTFKMKNVAPPTDADSLHASVYKKNLPEVNWMHNDVNAIIEDKTGKFWFGTRGYAFVYDGKTFIPITKKDGKPFQNVRSIIKDHKGNIWLGGYDGLWRYNGSTFTNFAHKFVGYIYEDKRGNIWTSSERDYDRSRPLLSYSSNTAGWALSRYDEKYLSDKKPAVTEITNKPMIFGILEDNEGRMWFGTTEGVYRYDGSTFTDFKGK